MTDITEQLAKALREMLVHFKASREEFLSGPAGDQGFRQAVEAIAAAQSALAAYEASKVRPELPMPPNERLQGTGPFGSEPHE